MLLVLFSVVDESSLCRFDVGSFDLKLQTKPTAVVKIFIQS